MKKKVMLVFGTRPIINESKCINCGLCVKHCPANHTYKFVDNMVTYAAYRTEPDKQIGSSSGGVAAALYELAISKKWSIIGTVIDSDFRVKMQLSNDKQAIESFKGSKYVQAYTIEALLLIVLALLVLLHARKDVQISLLEIFGGLAQNLLFISQIEKFR